MTKKQVRKERVYLAYSFTLLFTIRGSKAGTQAGQEPGSRNWSRDHGGVLLNGLLSVACSACFLICPGTTCLGVALAAMGWGLPHASLIKRIPHSHAHSTIWWSLFLNWASLFPGNSSFVKLADTQPADLDTHRFMQAALVRISGLMKRTQV